MKKVGVIVFLLIFLASCCFYGLAKLVIPPSIEVYLSSVSGCNIEEDAFEMADYFSSKKPDDRAWQQMSKILANEI